MQLAAQEAKAWARIGDGRQTEVALDRGRRPLDSMQYPENLDHHFVADPTKFGFSRMWPMGSSLEIFHAGWTADVGPVEV